MGRIPKSRRSDNARAERTDTKRIKAALYVCIPRPLLSYPPISHRRSGDDVTAFQFKIAGAIGSQARVMLAQERHTIRMGKTRAVMGLEQADRARYRGRLTIVNKARRAGQQIKLPVRHHTYRAPTYKPDPAWKAIRNSGIINYADLQKKDRKKPPPDIITIKLTANAVLRLAGVPDCGKHYTALPATLDRLMYPIGPCGPVLSAWQPLPHGRLRLEVSSEWVPSRNYQRIPWPLPRGSKATSLSLWLQGLDGPMMMQLASPVAALFARIGIVPRGHRSEQQFERAVDEVNRHNDTLDADALADVGIRVPGRYEVMPYRTPTQPLPRSFTGAVNYLRIVARPRRFDEVPVTKSPPPEPVKRLRLTPRAQERIKFEAAMAEHNERMAKWDRRQRLRMALDA